MSGAPQEIPQAVRPKAPSRRRRAGRRDFGVIISHGTPTEPAFSVRWWEGGKSRRRRGFTTRDDAEPCLARIRAELADGTRRPGEAVSYPEVKIETAIAEYERHRREKGNK